MNVKQKSSSPTSRDADSPPEITDAWIDGADLYQGDKLVRRGRSSARLNSGVSQQLQIFAA